VLDDCVGNSSPLGGVQQRCLRDSQLVDDSDEGTRPHRGPDGEDSCADHASLELCDGDRRCGNEEQVAQVVDVVTPAFLIVIARKNADSGDEIGMTGAADVYLHVGLIGSGSQTSVLLDDPIEDTTN
jgi:hypothetical protein